MKATDISLTTAQSVHYTDHGSATWIIIDNQYSYIKLYTLYNILYRTIAAATPLRHTTA